MTYKSSDYLKFQNDIRDVLMGEPWPFGKDEVVFLVAAGLSNRGADIDNVIKPLLDTFQSIYEDFNDNKVYGVYLIKDIVPKGEEYLDVTIRKLHHEDELQ